MIETAYILSAGFGTRLAPITNFIPKALFPIFGEPALKRLLQHLSRHNIKRFNINVHHHREQICYALQSQNFVPSGCTVEISVEEKILGTAGGLGNIFRNFPTGSTILVHNVDVVEKFEIEKAFDFHRETGAVATMILVKNPATDSVEIDSRGRIVSFYGGKWTYSGVMFIEPELVRTFPSNRFSNLTDLLMTWIEKRLVASYIEKNFWCDFGNFHKYLDMHVQILQEKIFDWEGAGEGIFIAQGAQVNGEILKNVWIGRNAYIPKGATINDSVIWDNTRVTPGRWSRTIWTPWGIVDG